MIKIKTNPILKSLCGANALTLGSFTITHCLPMNMHRHINRNNILLVMKVYCIVNLLSFAIDYIVYLKVYMGF